MCFSCTLESLTDLLTLKSEGFYIECVLYLVFTAVVSTRCTLLGKEGEISIRSYPDPETSGWHWTEITTNITPSWTAVWSLSSTGPKTWPLSAEFDVNIKGNFNFHTVVNKRHGDALLYTTSVAGSGGSTRRERNKWRKTNEEVSLYNSASECMCAAAATAGREERAEGRPLWVFVWLRLSSSLGKWKFNTPLQRSGYQVREEERKGEEGKNQALHRCGERNRKREVRKKRSRGSGDLREPRADKNKDKGKKECPDFALPPTRLYKWVIRM